MRIEDVDEVVANQLAVARQSIEERDVTILDLQKKVELLETMLNRLAAQRYGVPAPQPQPLQRPAPRRWTVR